jgi:hypothetical protein
VFRADERGKATAHAAAAASRQGCPFVDTPDVVTVHRADLLLLVDDVVPLARRLFQCLDARSTAKESWPDEAQEIHRRILAHKNVGCGDPAWAAESFGLFVAFRDAMPDPLPVEWSVAASLIGSASFHIRRWDDQIRPERPELAEVADAVAGPDAAAIPTM